jgi:hypothetical protein
MIVLKEYWNMIGLSLLSRVNIGLKVKESKLETFKVSQTFLYHLFVIVKV